jgi:hypothetical protein
LAISSSFTIAASGLANGRSSMNFIFSRPTAHILQHATPRPAAIPRSQARLVSVELIYRDGSVSEIKRFRR